MDSPKSFIPRPVSLATLPESIYGIIFDFDGVIVDSEKHWADIENPYLRQHIKGWKDSDYHQLIGRSLHEVYDYLVTTKQFTMSYKRYSSDYELMADRLYSTVAQPIREVRDLLNVLKHQGIQCAIASSSKRAWIDLALNAHGLEAFFNVIVSAHDNDVAAGKPSPDVYLRTIELLGKPANTLIAIEDSRNGVSAAKAANLYCLGLHNGDNSNQDLSSANAQLYSYKDLISCIN